MVKTEDAIRMERVLLGTPYDEPDEDRGKEETPMETVLYQATVRTQSTALNLRSAPGGKKIGSLPQNATVDVLDVSDTPWWCVRYAGMTGYASATYLACVVDKGDDLGTLGDEGWSSDGHQPTTTLVRDDDVSIVLTGRWRISED